MPDLGSGIKHEVGAIGEAVFELTNVSNGIFQMSQHSKEEWAQKGQGMKLSIAGPQETYYEWKVKICCREQEVQTRAISFQRKFL